VIINVTGEKNGENQLRKQKKEEDSFLVFKKNALQNFLKGVFFI